MDTTDDRMVGVQRNFDVAAVGSRLNKDAVESKIRGMVVGAKCGPDVKLGRRSRNDGGGGQ